MLRHIVMIKFANRDAVAETSEKVKQMLLHLETTVDSLKKMEVGKNINTRPAAFDMVLVADFENEQGLNSYRTHPAHVKVLDFLKKVVEKTAVTDYWI